MLHFQFYIPEFSQTSMPTPPMAVSPTGPYQVSKNTRDVKHWSTFGSSLWFTWNITSSRGHRHSGLSNYKVWLIPVFVSLFG